MENPFYSSGAGTKPSLNNMSYLEEDLSPLPEGVPVTLANLIHNLLVRNPSKVRNGTHGSEISGSHSDEYEDGCLQGCCAV
jgi:hypothetical protein